MMLSNDSTLWLDQMKKITREVDNDLGCFPYCRNEIVGTGMLGEAIGR